MKGFIAGLHLLAVCVYNLEEARAFYGDLLGLQELPRPQEVVEQFSSVWYHLRNAEPAGA